MQEKNEPVNVEHDPLVSLSVWGKEDWGPLWGSEIEKSWTSLVVQWLRICLAVQGTWVQSLVLEDPTHPGATKPVCRYYWGWRALEHVLCNKRSHHDEKPPFTTTRKSPRAERKTQYNLKKKKSFSAKSMKIWANPDAASFCQGSLSDCQPSKKDDSVGVGRIMS